MTARRDPAALPDWPRLLSRDLAAAYLGISPTTFDGLVDGKAMPAPRALPNVRRRLYDRVEIDRALDRLGGITAGWGEDDRETRKADWQRRQDRPAHAR